MEFKIKLANRIIKIRSQYEFVYDSSKEYWVKNKNEDIVIDYVRDEFGNKKKYDAAKETQKGYIECLDIYREIANAMLDYNTFLAHGVVLSVDNQGYMITAKSGVGKTTRALAWEKCIDNTIIVNGDKPLLIVGEDQIYGCGTPWCGKENRSANRIVPLKAILFLERSETNSVEEIPFNEAFIKFFQQTYKPRDKIKLVKTLDLIKKLEGKVKFYIYKSNLEEEAVIPIYNYIKDK